MSDAEALVNFLVQLCDTNTMKTVTAESLMMKILDVEKIFNRKETKSPSSTSASFHSTTHSSIDRVDSSSSLSSNLSCDSVEDVVNRTFLDFLMDFVTQFEFPQKIVTFLLHLLPNAEYKVLYIEFKFYLNWMTRKLHLRSIMLGESSCEKNLLINSFFLFYNILQ